MFRTGLQTSAAAVALFASSNAFAQSRAVNIPAQPVGRAVAELSRQGDVQILAARKITEGKTAKAVRGNITVSEAFARLLEGTGLFAEQIGPQTYTIKRVEGAGRVDAAYGAPRTAQLAADQSDGEIAPEVAQDIVVTGMRASLQSAQAAKRNSAQIVDSIVADDIGKLPDVNIAEALQRVTGVQITRNQGEGSGIAIRGLTQIRTELDGRSIFTASGGRNLSLEDVPSELLAAADVYKSPSADLIEGGIGGLINLRLRKPFDFAGFQAAAQVRGSYYDIADKVQPSASLMVSNRWNVGSGELGVLLSGSYQSTAFASDNVIGGNVTTRSDVYDYNGNGFIGNAADGTAEPGDAIRTPIGAGLGKGYGSRDRIGINGAIQWKPTDNLELYADGLYQHYNIKTNSVLLFVTDQGTGKNPAVPITLFPDSNILSSASWLNATIDSNAFTGDRTSTTWQAAGGVKWGNGPLNISSDLSYTKATSVSSFYQLAWGAVAPIFTQTPGDKYPGFQIDGIDLTDSNNYTLNRATQYVARNRGSEFALRTDAEYAIDSGFLHSLKVGVRYADRKETDGSVYVYSDLTAYKPSDFPESIAQHNLSDFFSSYGYDVNVPRQFAGPPISLVRDFDKIRAFAGLPAGVPTPTEQSTYRLTEKTLAGYAMANFRGDLGTVGVSGNIGVRVVQTKTSTDGTIQQPDGSFGPLSVSAKYTDVLPTANVKFDVTSKLVVRLAAGKTMTRPDFSQLSPSLSLDYLFHTGGAGNPALGPIRSKQADISVEYYLTKSSFAYVAGFLKNVDGFITTVATPEEVPGQSQPFLISRPQNGESGKIRGVELGWNQFLDFLPAPFDGLGFQANYTYVYSRGPSPLAGASIPLLGLSKNSFNLIGLYQKGPVSLRVAYNWRDKYLTGVVNAGAISPQYVAPQGFLDASVNYDFTPAVTVFVDAANLTHTLTQSYVSDRRSKLENYYADRRITLGVRAKF